MTPWQLAKSGTEHGEQTALFCFCAKAQRIGFALALDKRSWGVDNSLWKDIDEIPDLKWFHAIPNGGNRGDTEKSRAIEGGRMKAEGVKSGVLDTFWPLKRGQYSGIYIEMKRKALKNEKNDLAGCSDSQIEFGQFVTNNNFVAHVCYSWEEAAKALEWYYDLKG